MTLKYSYHVRYHCHYHYHWFRERYHHLCLAETAFTLQALSTELVITNLSWIWTCNDWCCDSQAWLTPDWFVVWMCTPCMLLAVSAFACHCWHALWCCSSCSSANTCSRRALSVFLRCLTRITLSTTSGTLILIPMNDSRFVIRIANWQLYS